MLITAHETTQKNPEQFHQTLLVTSVQLLFLALMPVLAYYSTLNNYFLNSDFAHVQFASKALQNPQLFLQEFTSSWLGAGDYELFYRPLPLFLLALNLLFSGVSPYGYHLTSLALHVGCVWSVYFLTLELLRWVRGAQWSGDAQSHGSSLTFNDVRTAFISAALFSVFPVGAEAIIWLGGRPDCAAGLFFVLTLAFWLREQRTNSRFIGVLSAVSYAVALLFKESAISLIFLPPLLCLLSGKPWKVRFRFIVSSCWKLLAIFLAYLTMRWFALGTIWGGYKGAFWNLFSYDESLQHWIEPERLRMLFFPLNPDLSFPVPMPVLFVIFYLSALIVFASKFRTLRMTIGLIGFCLIWFIISLIPEVKTAALTHSFASGRSLYIPIVPLCMLVSLILTQPVTSVKWKIVLSNVCAVGLVSSFFICDLVNNQAWNAASRATRSLQLQLAKLIAETPKELKVAVLNPPLNINGPYGLNQALLPMTQIEPFLSESNYHRIQILDREHFTERDSNLINATALRQYLLSFCVMAKWNSSSETLSKVALIPDMMPLSAHNIIVTALPDGSDSYSFEILIDPSLIPLSCEALEVSFSCEGTARGGFATVTWRDDWKDPVKDNYDTAAYADVIGDAKLHSYRFSLAEQVGWYLRPTTETMHLTIHNVKAVKDLSVRLASDANYVPRLRADNRYLSQSPTGLVPRGSEAVFICDTEVDGAKGLVIELSKPNECFETYKRTYRETQTSPNALKRWTADETSSTFRIPTANLAPGTYSVRAASLNDSRLIVGAFGDPVVFRVGAQEE